MSYERRFKPIIIALSEMAWARVEAAVWARLDQRRRAGRCDIMRIVATDSLEAPTEGGSEPSLSGPAGG